MKKTMTFAVALIGIAGLGYSMTPAMDFQLEGVIINSEFSYHLEFNSNNIVLDLNLLQVSIFPGSDYVTFHLGVLVQYCPTLSYFDVTDSFGFIYYPFKEILSFSFNMGMSLSDCLLNHFTYLVNAEMNIDIPFYPENYLTIGMGIQHRNAFDLFGYFDTGNYKRVMNTYCFSIGYRIKG
jgi:hypothetical protein